MLTVERSESLCVGLSIPRVRLGVAVMLCGWGKEGLWNCVLSHELIENND